MVTTKKRRRCPRPAADYVLYTPSAGDPKLFVIADHDKKPYTEQFYREHNAYHGLKNQSPRILNPAHLPSYFKLSQNRKIPSMFATVDTFVVVDDGVRRAIEELEPDTHQFIPVRMIHKNGEAEPRRFFILNVYRQVPAVALEEMGAKTEPTRDGGTQITLPSLFERDVRLRRDQLQGADHLFVDRRSWNLAHRYFVSQAMLAAIRSAGGRFSFVSLRPCTIVD